MLHAKIQEIQHDEITLNQFIMINLVIRGTNTPQFFLSQLRK